MLVEDVDRLLEAREYAYGAQNRPVATAQVPDGWIDTRKDRRFRHGVVVYKKPLSDREVRNFQLTPLIPRRDLAKQIAQEIDYPEAYVEIYDDDPREFASMLQMLDLPDARAIEGDNDRKLHAMIIKELK